MAAFAERLATKDTANAQPATVPCAVTLDRLARVFGTAWCKTALLAEKRTQRQLVEADQGNQELLSHEDRPSIDTARVKKLAVAAKFGYNTPSSKTSRQVVDQK